MSSSDLNSFFGADGLKYKRDALLSNLRKFVKHLSLDEIHRFTRELDRLMTSFQETPKSASSASAARPSS